MLVILSAVMYGRLLGAQDGIAEYNMFNAALVMSLSSVAVGTIVQVLLGIRRGNE